MTKEIPTERYISPEETQGIIHELRLMAQYNNGISKNHKSFKKLTGKQFRDTYK